MGLTGWLAIIQAALQFPDELLKLIAVLKTTPIEQHEALVKSIQAEADQIKKTGRPTWS